MQLVCHRWRCADPHERRRSVALSRAAQGMSLPEARHNESRGIHHCALRPRDPLFVQHQRQIAKTHDSQR